MSAEQKSAKQKSYGVELEHCIGFSGGSVNALHRVPQSEFIVYPVGSIVVISGTAIITDSYFLLSRRKILETFPTEIATYFNRKSLMKKRGASFKLSTCQHEKAPHGTELLRFGMRRPHRSVSSHTHTHRHTHTLVSLTNFCMSLIQA